MIKIARYLLKYRIKFSKIIKAFTITNLKHLKIIKTKTTQTKITKH